MNMCQCPQRASTHFYPTLMQQKQIEMIGVNALNGLLLISTLYQLFQKIKMHVCQCPQRASTHFYILSVGVGATHEMCQCPQRASTHFYK